MATADKPKVVTTRWRWVRRVPVRNGGNIYGQTDLPCDTSDIHVFMPLPTCCYERRLVFEQSDAHASDRRSHLEAGYPRPASMKWEPYLARGRDCAPDFRMTRARRRAPD